MSDAPTALLPCPFCGGTHWTSVQQPVNGPFDQGWFVGCWEPTCLVRPKLNTATREEAITAWNHRAPKEPT